MDAVVSEAGWVVVVVLEEVSVAVIADMEAVVVSAFNRMGQVVRLKAHRRAHVAAAAVVAVVGMVEVEAEEAVSAVVVRRMVTVAAAMTNATLIAAV